MPNLYLYILRAHTQNTNIWKIGITNRAPADRLKEIQADGRKYNDISQHAQIYAYFKLYNADKLERRLHHHYSRQQHKGIKGSGKTEWFSLRYPFYALWLLWGHWLLNWLMWCCLWIAAVGLGYHFLT